MSGYGCRKTTFIIEDTECETGHYIVRQTDKFLHKVIRGKGEMYESKKGNCDQICDPYINSS